MLLPIALPTGSPVRPLDNEIVRGRYCDGAYVQTGLPADGDDYDEWLAEHDRIVALKALQGLSGRIRNTHTRRNIIDLLKADISAYETGDPH
jgi:hypothetical protein